MYVSSQDESQPDRNTTYLSILPGLLAVQGRVVVASRWGPVSVMALLCALVSHNGERRWVVSGLTVQLGLLRPVWYVLGCQLAISSAVMGCREV